MDTGIRRHDDMGRATSHGFGRLFGVGSAAYAMHCDQDRPSAGGEPLTAPIIDVSAFHLRHAGECAGIHDVRCAGLEKAWIPAFAGMTIWGGPG